MVLFLSRIYFSIILTFRVLCVIFAREFLFLGNGIKILLAEAWQDEATLNLNAAHTHIFQPGGIALVKNAITFKFLMNLDFIFFFLLLLLPKDAK